MKRWRFGTRGSPLARRQTDAVRALAGSLVEAECVIVHSQGDQEPARPVASFDGPGVFTAALEQALLTAQIDIAVHSFKDLPLRMAPGLCLLAVGQREDPRDLWISGTGLPWAEVPAGTRVGSGSPRRVAQLAALRSDLVCQAIRGNLDTRLEKLHAGETGVDELVRVFQGD